MSTRQHFFACGSSGAHASQLALFCVISQNGHLHRHSSRLTRNVHGYLLTALHLCFIFRTGVFTAIRNMAFSLGVLPNRTPSQVMSPTIQSRLAVRSFRLLLPSRRASVGATYNSGEDILHLHRRKWMKDSIWECWLHRCTHRGGRQVQPHQAFIRESQVEVPKVCRSHIPRERERQRIFAVHR